MLFFCLFSDYFSSRPSSSFKHNASFVSRLPTIRRHKSTSLHSPSLHKLVHQGYQGPRATRGFTDFISSSENLGKIAIFFVKKKKQLTILIFFLFFVERSGVQPPSNTNGNSNVSNEPSAGGATAPGNSTSRQLNASYSEDSVNETALSKRNSDGEWSIVIYYRDQILCARPRAFHPLVELIINL